MYAQWRRNHSYRLEVQLYVQELTNHTCILVYKQQLPIFCQTHWCYHKININFPSNDHENCGEMRINLKPTQRGLLMLGVTCHQDYQRIKIGILMESLGNECLATVGPTHDPDTSMRLSLNECIQLHFFIDWILIDDLS